MVVKVDAVEKLIIMGDLYYGGFNRALSKYGTELFSGDYEFCKVGHHGVRNGGVDGNQNVDKLNQEIALYKTYINAFEYIFTASTTTKNDVTYKNNYNKFKKGFEDGSVDKTSVFGNICIEISKNGYEIDREMHIFDPNTSK